MSLYLGNDLALSKVLHITNGQHDVNTLKSGPFIDTHFHSNLDYLTYTTASCTITTLDATRSNLYVTAEVRNLIGNKAWFSVDSAGNIIDCYFKFYGVYYPYSAVVYYFNHWLDSNNMYVPLAAPGQGTIYILNIDSGVFIPSTKSSTDIVMKSNNLVIKGVNLLDFSYITSSVLNDTDPVVNFYGTNYQMVNSSNLSGPLELKSNSQETKVLIGNKAIIDSTKNKSIRHLASYVKSIPTNSSYTHTFSLPEDMSDSGMIVAQFVNDQGTLSQVFIIPKNSPEKMFTNVDISFPAFGARLLYYCYMSSTSNSVTIRRQTIYTTGVSISPTTLYINIFG